MTSRRLVINLLSLGAAVLVSGSAFAQSYPSRPVHWIVGYPAGGATDILARLVGNKL